MEKELDKLIQQWACTQRSQISGRQAECGHHIVRRANKLTRWNIRNIMPLTYEEHYFLHNNNVDFRTKEQIAYYEENKNKSWHGLITKEFMLEKKKELCNILN